MRDNIPQSPQEWDEDLFTLTKGRYGLYEFSRVVAYEILKTDMIYIADPMQLPKLLRGGRSRERKQIRKMIRELESLKKRNAKTLIKVLQSDGYMSDGKITEREISLIRNRHPEIFQWIEEIEDDYKERLTRGLPWIRRGHLTDTKSKIAFIFAQVIKKENGQPNWAVIESLLIWFWERFKGASYRNELADDNDPVYITEKTLSNAYSKAMKNPDKKSSIEQSARGYFSFLRSGFGQGIAFRKNYIQFGPHVPVGMDIWSGHPIVFFPDGKILKEKVGRKRHFQEGRSWNRKMSRLINDWVAFQRAARKNYSTLSSGGIRHPA
jgi:hypothetical protein